MPRARSIPSSSISSEGNTSLTNIQQPIITKQVGTVKAIRKPIPKEKKKKRKKVAIDPNDEVEVPVVEQITSSKANTTNFTKFNSRSQLFEILKNTEYNFKLVGKIRLNASRVHYIFASDSTILNTEYSKFVYIKLKATDLKDSVGQLYRRQYSAVAPFIQQGFEFLVDKPVADLSKEAIKLQNTGEIVPLPNKKSIIDKLPAALVEKYLMEPVVPNGIKLTEKDILEELLDIWMGEFDQFEDYDYLLDCKRSILVCHPIINQLPELVKKNTKNDTSAMEFLEKCFKTNSRHVKLQCYHNLYKDFLGNAFQVPTLRFWKTIYEKEINEITLFLSNKKFKSGGFGFILLVLIESADILSL